MVNDMKIKQRKLLVLGISILILVMCIASALINNFSHKSIKSIEKNTRKQEKGEKELLIVEDLLTINPFSRPGTALTKVNNIVVHYVGNPKTTAKENRDYFESLSVTGETYASSHYVVGIDGEVIQCIPLNEESYCSNNRNNDTISIEVCHVDETGKFTDESYLGLVQLCAWLCKVYGLKEDDIIRHYDITGKVCPKYYVDYPTEWDKFKVEVAKRL